MSRWRRRINSHELFDHDSIDSLGYDWSRVAEPRARPRHPLRIYLPRSIEDIVTVVRETGRLGIRPRVRSKGHSSNDLVVAERGSVLVTEKLDRVLAVDESALTVTTQAGAVLAEVDEHLAPYGLGLPVIGDHAHITVGGFTSVGGITASSFRHGLFVDNVLEVEYVTWDGEVARASRAESPDRLDRVLMGLGREGVVSTVTFRVIRIDKFHTIWRNRQSHHRRLEEFLRASRERFADPPPDARFMKGMFVDFGRAAIGEFSVYSDTVATPAARLVNHVAYTGLHKIGFLSGKLPGPVDQALKLVGMAGIMFSPPYALVKYAEASVDKILDSTVGDPTRYLAVIMREDAYEAVTARVFAILREYRKRHGCFRVLSAYVKGIRSPYLAQGRPGDDRWAETVFYVATVPDRLPTSLLDQVVADIDDVCVETGSYRYMHTRTSRDPERLARIDPNAAYAGTRVPWPAG
jgi:hypothetical protein